MEDSPVVCQTDRPSMKSCSAIQTHAILNWHNLVPRQCPTGDLARAFRE